MSAAYGHNLKLYVDGSSHGEYISMRLEGFPAGLSLDMAALEAFMQRRAPGRDQYSTSRREEDKPCFCSGLSQGVTDGGPVEAIIYNQDQRPADYHFADTPRPSHADYTAAVKYGPTADLAGGGRFSGRLTALYCLAGGLCLQYLAQRGVAVFSHIYSIGPVGDMPFDPAGVSRREQELLASRPFPTLDEEAGARMRELIAQVRAEGDSIGGVAEATALGLPTGLGEHPFAGAEARLAAALFAIPGVKGVEFGSGFAGSAWRGSQNNDPFIIDRGQVRTAANNSGGILGGMTSGMPLLLRAAFKPTPSISREQDTVSLSRMEPVKLTVSGRHDPCLLPRALPVCEAVLALAIMDMLLDEIE